MSKKIIVTGGLGFIGSNLIELLLQKKYFVINIDKVTYSSNFYNVKNFNSLKNYRFIKCDIGNKKRIKDIFFKYKPKCIFNLAAESHVDNSIKNPFPFALTNVQGTLNLLEATRIQWGKNIDDKLFYHVSTDEVFGTLGVEGKFTEISPYNPRSPYSASKAASDHLVRAYYHTYNLPILLSNCSNNYGPAQHFEKLIPLMIQNIINKKSLPVYGEGKNIRDWLYVEDHVEAIDMILHKGKIGESYLLGGNNEKRNIDIVLKLIKITDAMLGRPEGYSKKLINFVSDRPGHDYRYAIDNSKVKEEFGWNPRTSFESGLIKTVRYYLDL